MTVVWVVPPLGEQRREDLPVQGDEKATQGQSGGKPSDPGLDPLAWLLVTCLGRREARHGWGQL